MAYIQLTNNASLADAQALMEILEEAGLDTTEELGRGRIAIQQPGEKSIEEIAEEAWEEFGQEIVEQADENIEDVDDDGESDSSDEPEESEQESEDVDNDIREMIETGRHTHGEIAEHLDVDIDRVERVHRELDDAEPNDQPGVEEEETNEDPQQDDEDDEPTVQEKKAERILDALREHGALSAQNLADEADLKYAQTFYNIRNNTDLLDDVEQKPDPDSGHWNAKLYYLPGHEDVDQDQESPEGEGSYEDECVDCGTDFKANTYEGLQDVLEEHQCDADDGGGDQGKVDGGKGELSQSSDDVDDDAGDKEPGKSKGPKIDIACRDCNRMFQSDEEYEEHDCPAEEDGGAREERQRRDRIKELADGA